MRLGALAITAASVATFALGAGVPGSASAATTDPVCDTVEMVVAADVWEVFAPTATGRLGTLTQACYLRYGDNTPAVKRLQSNLRYCYGIPVTVNGSYDAATRAAVIRAQKHHGIAVDGVYGPQTFKAMRWRLYNNVTYSTNCYASFAGRIVRPNAPSGTFNPFCLRPMPRNAGNGWTVSLPGQWTRTSAVTFTCYLKAGDVAEAVYELQADLHSCYRSTVPINGRYDSRTVATVKAVQRLYRLRDDGVYGPATMKAMYWRLFKDTVGLSEKCYSPF